MHGSLSGKGAGDGEKISSAAIALHFISCVCINDEEGLFSTVFAFPCKNQNQRVNAELSQAPCEHQWGTSPGQG